MSTKSVGDCPVAMTRVKSLALLHQKKQTDKQDFWRH
jgi:hypothetical protein